MYGKESRIKKSINNLWDLIEPLIIEFIAFLIVIITVIIIEFYSQRYLTDQKLQESIYTIKQIVVPSLLTLLAVHTFGIAFIRVFAGLWEEIRDRYDEIKRTRKSKRNLLRSKSVKFDEAGEVKILKK